jgi:hypothetical protein
LVAATSRTLLAGECDYQPASRDVDLWSLRISSGREPNFHFWLLLLKSRKVEKTRHP